jgi:hypothetical protein
MKYYIQLVTLITLLAVACVGMHVYVVESELNDARELQQQNLATMAILNQASDAITFARSTQIIAIMAEERAYELAYKLDVAASVIGTLEAQLVESISALESQSLQLQDLIDQNSELQTTNSWNTVELERLKRKLQTVQDDLAITKLKLISLQNEIGVE